MERHVTDPRWIHNQLRRVDRRHDLGTASVLVATPNPLVAHLNGVVDQRSFVTLPHQHGWMVRPTYPSTLGRLTPAKQDVQYLETLDTLLTEPTVVETLGRLGGIGIW